MKNYILVIIISVAITYLVLLVVFSKTLRLIAGDGSAVHQESLATQKHGTESYWQDIIQNEIGGEKEYRLEDGTRVDLLFDNEACEIDWANKWAEGVGQSIYYGVMTEKTPLVILLVKKDGWEKYRERVERCGIECWTYDTRIADWINCRTVQ